MSEAKTTTAVRFSSVTLTVDDVGGKPAEPPILSNVDLEVPKGAVTYLIGDSGGGKSSLLHLINRMYQPSQGRVEVLGRNVREWNVRTLRTTAVYVPQRPVALGDDVRTDLTQSLQWLERSWQDDDLLAALEVAQLANLELNRETKGLSEGQLARLGLARALVLRPRLLLLDEPTAALDVRSARQLLGALGAWMKRSGATIFCVTHRVHELAELPGEVAVLLSGHLEGVYPQKQLLAGDVSPSVQAFLGQLKTSQKEETFP